MESHGSNNQSDKKQWRAEEAIAGNSEALQALRDLITFPLYYSTQAHILGLKVNSNKNTNFVYLLFVFNYHYYCVLALVSA
jgi:hypothetical protein